MFPTFPSLLLTGGPFEWSGEFPIFAADSAEALNWLGADGSLTPDIGDLSHFYNSTILSPLDEGTNPAAAGASDLTDFNGSLVTLPAYGGGTRDMITYVQSSVPGTRSSGVFDFPIPMDGTRSFVIGMIHQINAAPVAVTNVNVVQMVSTGPSRGWSLTNSPGAPSQFSNVMFSTPSGFQSVGSPVGSVVVGRPTLVVWNFDFAASLIKIFTSDGQFATSALLAEDFNTSIVMKFGDPTIASWAGARYTWAQMFMYDYSGALDAELSIDNMTRYLKFTDGVL